MTSRTPEELLDALDKDLAWRKQELVALRFTVETSPDAEQPIMIRAAIALVYAHWEGYVKGAGTRYLKYVAMRRLPYSDLADPFAALGLRREASKLVHARTPDERVQAYRDLVACQNAQSSLPADNVIDTGSNLNFRRFERILDILGIESAVYSTREAMIDERLLKTRNSIAHGDFVEPDFDQYDEVHTAVLEMLSAVRDQIAEAVQNGTYRSSNTAYYPLGVDPTDQQGLSEPPRTSGGKGGGPGS